MNFKESRMNSLTLGVAGGHCPSPWAAQKARWAACDPGAQVELV